MYKQPTTLGTEHLLPLEAAWAEELLGQAGPLNHTDLFFFLTLSQALCRTNPSPPVCAGAVDEEGRMPFYAEECASMLAVTFSGGDKMLRSIVSPAASALSQPHRHVLLLLLPCAVRSASYHF